MAWILQTERLGLRPLTAGDRKDLAEILQDDETMTAYEGAFSDQEVDDWLQRQLDRYQAEGVGLWAVIERTSGAFLGQCGITMQDIPNARVPEVGYLFKRCYWHHGYATEAARGCLKYGFEVLQAPSLYSIIRDSNLPSRRVAERNGLRVVSTFDKHFRGVRMPHLVYVMDCTQWQETK